ncbi:hypothetical protein ACP70R_008767 [Stipagrostis hirtigluma subsp. patula]
MAAVLDALANYVTEMTMGMVEGELRMLLGASSEIERLGDKVEMMKACLADAERRRIDEPNVQRWVTKLKGAMYEATDMLDLCQLEAEKRRSSDGGEEGMEEEKAPGCLQPLLFCLRNPSFAHTMGKRMKDLNARLDAIHEEMARFRFEPISSSRVVVPPSDATAPSRTTTSLLDETGIVGEQIERDTNALVQELLADEPAIKVVSIAGAGGMGKSTLASKIFNDKTIQVEFKKKIWLSVTETYDAAKLLGSAITQAGEQPRGEDQEVLSRSLADILSTGKFLVVMDDVWSDGPWVHVLQRPIVQAARNQPQSRVIITTRSRELVQHMGATYHRHHVKAINDEDAWSLLKKQLQNIVSESDLDQLKDIGMKIVRRCDGLPLAIKAVGGVLRMKRANEREWKGVLDDPVWSTDKTHSDLSFALRLSYEDLSPPVKQCFLYYSLLPKGDNYSFIVIGMWISQGYIQVTAVDQGQRTKEAEDIGNCYYNDLITRNLIERSETSVDGGYSKMHDVIRSFARYMAKEEALVVQVSASETGPQLASSTKFRHVSIESTESQLGAVVLPEWGGISRKQELLRSLIIKGRIQFGPSNNPSLSRFPSLRALFVAHAESERFVESLCKLKHLRFLHLEDTDISRLPDDIDKMKFLEYIGLQSCPNFSGQFPSSILKLEYLRCLCIWGYTKFIVPKGLGGLKELNKITKFSVQIQDEWCSLEEIAPLCKLREIELFGLAAVPLGSLAAKAKLHDKLQLESLILYCFASAGVVRLDEVTQEDCQRVEEVFGQLCPPPHLETLGIVDYIGLLPPSWMRMTAAASPIGFNSLTRVQFVGLPFCTQLPDGLCQLPSLEILFIDHAIAVKRVGPEFQRKTDSSSMVRPAFPRLQNLRFKNLREWEEWEWEEEEEAEAKDIAMPALHTLAIFECKLDRLPPGLASSRRLALRKLLLWDVSRIAAVENFPSVVDLDVRRCPTLKAIRGFTKLQTVVIVSCPALEVLEAGLALDTVELAVPAMETLPEYLRGLKPRVLAVTSCHQKLRSLLSCSDDSSVDYLAEMDKIKGCRNLWCCDRWIVPHRQQLE